MTRNAGSQRSDSPLRPQNQPTWQPHRHPQAHCHPLCLCAQFFYHASIPVQEAIAGYTPSPGAHWSVQTSPACYKIKKSQTLLHETFLSTTHIRITAQNMPPWTKGRNHDNLAIVSMALHCISSNFWVDWMGQIGGSTYQVCRMQIRTWNKTPDAHEEHTPRDAVPKTTRISILYAVLLKPYLGCFRNKDQ